MTTISILAILAILGGVATLSVTGFYVISTVAAQTPTGDNATMTGNMTGGNVTGDNTTEVVGSISGYEPPCRTCEYEGQYPSSPGGD